MSELADHVCENVDCKGMEGRNRRVYLRARPSTRFARIDAPSTMAIAGKYRACERSDDWKRSRYRG